MIRNILLALAILFGLYYIFWFEQIPAGFEMLFKLLPMGFILLFAITTPQKDRRYFILVCAGLLFCAIGDYTLQWFIVGLCFFLTGHLLYIAAFSKGTRAVPLALKVVMLLYGTLMAIWMTTTLLSRSEVVLAIAVIAYIGVILIMGWMAFRTDVRFTIIGALLFITSDSILAINRFIIDVPAAHELIMLTYYGAQVFIALSIEKYFEFRNKVIK